MLDINLSNIAWAILILWGSLTVIANSVNSIFKAYEIFKQKSPTTELTAQIIDHDRRIKEIEKISQKHERALEKLENQHNDDRKVMLKSLSALIQHACGNVDLEHLREVNDELQEHILK